MLIDFLLVGAGLIGLVLGGDILVRGSLDLSRRFGLSPAVIGIVVIGFGTSMPELVTSLTAAFQGAEGVAIGNVAGSNIANILLILGVTALLSPVACDVKTVRRDGAAMMLMSLVLAAGILWWGFPRLLSLGLLVGMAGYLLFVLLNDGGSVESDEEAGSPPHLGRALIFAGAGLVALILGAKSLVTGAVGLATAFGISEALIGLTIVAVGTSVPELAASISAALKKQGSMAFGNVIGSNIFNIGAIMGVTGVVHPLAPPTNIGVIDVTALLGAAILAILFGATGLKISRWEGAVLIGGYLSYITVITVMAVS
ncbi:calcium/sodium antiporter [Parvularcula marina]|uniref:calcium/sodium antiporter n=1 Tax=Parvularcula marina TaxID=2292771 RepID=UPI003516A55A